MASALGPYQWTPGPILYPRNFTELGAVEEVNGYAVYIYMSGAMSEGVGREARLVWLDERAPYNL